MRYFLFLLFVLLLALFLGACSMPWSSEPEPTVPVLTQIDTLHTITAEQGIFGMISYGGRVYGATNYHLVRTSPDGNSVEVLDEVRWERSVGADPPWTQSSGIAGFGPHFVVYNDTLIVADQYGNLWAADTNTWEMHRFRGYPWPWFHQARVYWMGEINNLLYLLGGSGRMFSSTCSADDIGGCPGLNLEIDWDFLNRFMSTQPFVQGDSLTYDAPEGRLARVSLADGGVTVSDGPPEMAERALGCYFPLGDDLGVINQKGVWRRVEGSWEKIPNAPSAKIQFGLTPSVISSCRTMLVNDSGTLLATRLGGSNTSSQFVLVGDKVQVRETEIRLGHYEIVASASQEGLVYFTSTPFVLRFDPAQAFGDGK
jgi:hypothetical protein